MQLPENFPGRNKLPNYGKISLLKLMQNFFCFEIQIQKKHSLEMMRELENMFQSLLDDFNEKVSNFSYFTNFNAPIENHIANAGGSISDSYEEISMDGNNVQEESMKPKILVFVDSESESPHITRDNNVTTNENSSIQSSTTRDFVFDDSTVPTVTDNEDISVKSEINSDYSPFPRLGNDLEISQPLESDGDDKVFFENYSQENVMENAETFEINYKTAKEKLHENAIDIVPDNKNICENVDTSNNEDSSLENGVIINKYEDIKNARSRQISVDSVKKGSQEKSELNNDENNSEFIFEQDLNQNYKIQNQKTNLESSEVIIKTEKPINEINNSPFDKTIVKIRYRDDVNQSIPQNISVCSCRSSSDLETILQTNQRESMKERKSSSLNDACNRRMWSEMPEVMESGILKTLTKKQIQLQEARFEIITSEASYYRSLVILTKHFFSAELFTTYEDKETIVSPIDKHHIFSNVIFIMKTSCNLLKDLEQRWHDEKPVLCDICDIVWNHAISEDFQSYVTYLRNQQYQTQALKRLSENEYFKQQLSKLEASPECGKLSLDSFLMLPMQRLTRLKLLVEAVSKLQNSEEITEEISESVKNNAFRALDKIKKLLNVSNTEKGLMDQKSALISLNNRIYFPPNVKSITFSNKILLREEELRIHPFTGLKTLRKISKKKQPLITVVLFNDLLIVTKKKNGRLLVLDYSNNADITIEIPPSKRNISSTEVSRNTSALDVNFEQQSPIRIIGSTLMRSKTSLTGEERKRLSVPLNNSFTSMPQINKTEIHEFKHQTITIKFMKSDVFPDPLYLITRDRKDRDLWLSFNKDNSENQMDSSYRTNFSKIQKSTSLKIKTNHDKTRLIFKGQSSQTIDDE